MPSRIPQTRCCMHRDDLASLLNLNYRPQFRLRFVMLFFFWAPLFVRKQDATERLRYATSLSRPYFCWNLLQYELSANGGIFCFTERTCLNKRAGNCSLCNRCGEWRGRGHDHRCGLPPQASRCQWLLYGLGPFPSAAWFCDFGIFRNGHPSPPKLFFSVLHVRVYLNCYYLNIHSITTSGRSCPHLPTLLTYSFNTIPILISGARCSNPLSTCFTHPRLYIQW